jgi:hypothetical protein
LLALCTAVRLARGRARRTASQASVLSCAAEKAWQGDGR